MKLIKARRTGLQSLGRNQSSLTGTESATPAAFAAAGSALNSLAQSAAQITELKAKREGQDYSLSVSKAEGAFWDNIGGRDFIPVDEIPRDLRTPEMELKRRVPSASIIPQWYEQAIGGVVEEASFLVSNPALRKDQKKNMQEVFTNNLTQVTKGSAAAYENQILADQLIDKNQAVADGNMKGAIDAIDNMAISDAERSAAKAEVIQDFENTAYSDVDIGNDVGEIQDAIDVLLLSEDDYKAQGGSLGQKERTQWLRQLRTSYKRANAHQEALIEKEKQRQASNLAINIENRESSLVAQDRAFADDIITGPVMTANKKRIMKLAKDDTKDANLKTIAYKSFTTGAPLVPGDADSIRGVELLYQDAVDEIADIPAGPERQAAEDQIVSYGIDIAAKTNILPKQIKDMMKSYAVVGSPAEALRGSQIYSELQIKNPVSIEGFSVSSAAIYDGMAAAKRSGMDQEKALEIVRANATKTPEELSVLDYNFKSDSDIGKASEMLDDLYGSEDQFDVDVFGTPAKPTAAAVAAFQSVTSQFYRFNGGDIDAAYASALKEVKRVSSGSAFASPDDSIKVTQYAMEKMFSMGADQVEYEKERLSRIMSRYTTSLTEGYLRYTGNPGPDMDYQILYNDADGLPQPVNDKAGKPVRFKPDLKGYAEIAMSRAQIAQTKSLSEQLRLGRRKSLSGRNRPR